MRFQQGDAGGLGYADGAFDGAVSNLTFHEVRSAADTRDVVREALRVVKPGGTFAFVDYFYDPKHYGSAAGFEKYLRQLGVSRFEMKPLREEMALPLLLRYPRILGRAGILFGRK